ncbi:scavenger receptor cysteine-rich type 1 protein M160-like [Thalassophryne amazonica]|uniref:scavenger receptor cysteine-rich type 1 protein M160-like n=1 Tax=Thalassophryne amazonica TaxID=390379 RepID=UPI0014719684|nr:scavenger receptor cysteine-rich type 1 protein M160-like [Thalassophryne amazonica]
MGCDWFTEAASQQPDEKIKVGSIFSSQRTADKWKGQKRQGQTVQLDMDHMLLVLVLLSNSGLQIGATQNSTDPVRLVGGASRCAGTLEMKVQEEWRPVDDWHWSLKTAADSVRLVNGSSLCSGRLEVKWNQSWSSVCEDDFDQQDAQVVCRELGCGPPVVLQGALYGDVAAPKWTKEFQCGGKESGLLACGSSGSDRNTCSPAKAVGLTCSEPFRLAGGASRCAGTLEVKVQEDWRLVDDGGRNWSLKTAGVVCQHLDCGSAVYTNRTYFASNRPAWRTTSVCVQAGSALRDCGTSVSSSYSHQITCSDLLVQPSISLYSTVGGASEVHQQEFQVFRGSPFTVSCSIQPQYPGGSFQLIFTSTNTTWNSTKPAVNHSASSRILLQTTPTKETTVFIISTFFLITSHLRVIWCLWRSQDSRLEQHKTQQVIQRPKYKQ